MIGQPNQAGAGISSSGPNGLRAHAAAHDLLVGSAVVIGQVRSDAAYRALLQDQANILVADWQMKWNVLRPAPNKFNFSDADWLVAYALQNQQKFRGHNLCWHEALPSWFAGYANSGNARGLLTHHIQTVVGHYAGKIQSWDVVNEAVLPSDGRPDGLRNSPWLKLVGKDYIDLAYSTARQADPKALLTYNEFALEPENSEGQRKRDAVLNLLQGMKSRGIPIDAVGLQSHLGTYKATYGPGVLQFVRDVAKLGLRVFITELDVDDGKVPGTDTERDGAVASVYSGYLGMLLPEPNVDVLITWELRDSDSWMKTGLPPRPDHTPRRPLPFDSNGEAKPAFLSMRNAIDRCGMKSS